MRQKKRSCNKEVVLFYVGRYAVELEEYNKKQQPQQQQQHDDSTATTGTEEEDISSSFNNSTSLVEDEVETEEPVVIPEVFSTNSTTPSVVNTTSTSQVRSAIKNAFLFQLFKRNFGKNSANSNSNTQNFLNKF